MEALSSARTENVEMAMSLCTSCKYFLEPCFVLIDAYFDQHIYLPIEIRDYIFNV